MKTRENLKLGEEINEHFVRGLMKGYNRYLEVRIDAAEELKVSSGYAYVRGNHLEDAIAKEESMKNVSFDLASAGSWRYLQFKVTDSDKKYLVIIRRSERISDTQKELKRKNNEEKEKNWLYQLSKNNEHLKLSKLIREESDQQLIIFGDNPIDNKAIITQTQLDIELEERYDRFYILSYEIDNNNLIDDASLLMLDPRTLELAEIETLRPLVVKYQSLIDRELLLKANEAITPEEFSGVTAEYSIHQAEEDLPASPADYPIEEPQTEDEIKDI